MDLLTPIWISLKTATAATAISFFIAVYAARLRLRFAGRALDLLDAILLFPLAVPPTVIGLALLLTFGRSSPVGEWLHGVGLSLVFTWPGAVLAATVVAFPIMYTTLRAAFLQVDPALLEAARVFGSRGHRLTWSILLPLCWPSAMAGVVLTFMRALGEFGATLMFAGNLPGRTQTAPIAIYFAVEGGDFRLAMSLAGIVLALATGVVCLLAWLSRRKNA